MTEYRPTEEEALPPITELAGCVIEESGKVLLIHRKTDERDQWEIPGGKIELGEDPIVAASREIKEELGVEVEIGGTIGSKVFQEGIRRWRNTWFEGRIIVGEPAVQEAMHDQIGYFDWEELRMMEGLSSSAKDLVQFHFTQEP